MMPRATKLYCMEAINFEEKSSCARMESTCRRASTVLLNLSTPLRFAEGEDRLEVSLKVPTEF